MSAEAQSYRKVKLTKLLETSLGAPEPGCVNFNLLRLMLSTIINHLKIEEVEAEVDGEILDTLDATPHPKENREEGFRTIQDRLRTLENQMDTLNALPNSRELLDKVFPSSTDKSHLEVQTNQDQRRVSELWQSVQMKRRVDATEEGLSRLSSLTDDLLDQIKRLSDENKRLSIALEEAKKGSDLNDKLMDLERKLLELEKRQLQDESLLKNVVHMDALRGLVFWHSLGAAITGIDYITAYANAADKLATKEKSAVEKKSDHGLVYKWPENKLACPDPDLSSTLRKLGIVASGFDNVLQRIDRLEELIGKKADREELTGLGVPPELLDRLAQLETAVKELAKEREKPVSSQSVINGKAILSGEDQENLLQIQNDNEMDAIPTQNKKLIKTMQDTLAVLQKQIAQMHQLITATQTEMKGVREQFADLQQFVEDIDVRKVDGAQMDAELMKKADKSQLADLLTKAEFLETNQALHNLIEDLFKKLTNTEEELRSLLSALEAALDSKLDREELEQLREWLEKRFKALSSRIRAVRAISPIDTTATTGDDAAGLRRGLMQHFHCISCDRPLQVPMMPDYAESRRLLSCRTARPCATAHELDYYTGNTSRTGYIEPPVRRSGLNIYDLYGIPRRCGGTHTTTNPQRRVNRGNTARSVAGVDECGKTLPYISARDGVSIEGHDGHIYRGRFVSSDHVPVNGAVDDPSHSPLCKPNEDSAEAVRFPHLPASRSALSGWPQETGHSPSPRNLRLLAPRQSGSPERATTRRVQLVQPNVHTLDGLTSTPSGYAVIMVPKAGEIDDGEQINPQSSPIAEVTRPTSGGWISPQKAKMNVVAQNCPHDSAVLMDIDHQLVTEEDKKKTEPAADVNQRAGSEGPDTPAILATSEKEGKQTPRDSVAGSTGDEEAPLEKETV